jgi:cytochrome b561
VSAGGRDTAQNRLHLAIVLVCIWLVATSPWVSMLRRFPSSAGFFDYAHVALGTLALLLALPYAATCLRGGRWRNHFSWVTGDVRPLARDVTNLFHGCLPSAEGGGLFAIVEGLLLLSLLLVAITGAGWWLAQGSSEAIEWRAFHVVGARVFIGLVVAHVVAVATHLWELA